MNVSLSPQLLSTIYSAVLEPKLWPGALRMIAREVQCRDVCMDAFDFGAETGHIFWHSGLSDAFIHAYEGYFSRRNVLIEAGEDRFQDGAVLRTSDVISEREFTRSEIYTDLFRPRGYKYIGSACMRVDARLFAQFSFLRAVDAPEFSDAEVDRLRLLAPHLRRAFRIQRRISKLEIESSRNRAFLDTFEQPLFVVTRDRRVAVMNQAAAAFLESEASIKLVAGRLQFAHARTNARFAALLNTGGGGNVVPKPATRAVPYRARVFPLSSEHLDLMADTQSFGVMIFDPLAEEEISAQVLRMVFGFTLAEARLVRGLVQGKRLRDYSERAGISFETGRTHLKQAMHKADVHNQADLVRVALRLFK